MTIGSQRDLIYFLHLLFILSTTMYCFKTMRTFSRFLELIYDSAFELGYQRHQTHLCVYLRGSILCYVSTCQIQIEYDFIQYTFSTF